MGVAPSGVLGVELGQFLLGLLLDPLAPFADFIGEALAVFGDVFEDDLVEQDGHGVEVAGKGVRAHAQGFERDGAAAGKRVHDQRPGARGAAQRLVRGLGQRPRLVSRYSLTVELSQLAKSAMKSSRALRSSRGLSTSIIGLAWMAMSRGNDSLLAFSACLSAQSVIRVRAASRNAGGHGTSSGPGAGSGHSAARITARHAASGRLAHQMCSVEMCPCRMDFSRRACAEIRLIGRSTSMSLLGYRFIRLECPASQSVPHRTSPPVRSSRPAARRRLGPLTMGS